MMDSCNLIRISLFPCIRKNNTEQLHIFHIQMAQTKTCTGIPMQCHATKDKIGKCDRRKKNTNWYCTGCRRWLCMTRRAEAVMCHCVCIKKMSKTFLCLRCCDQSRCNHREGGPISQFLMLKDLQDHQDIQQLPGLRLIPSTCTYLVMPSALNAVNHRQKGKKKIDLNE